MKIIGNLKCEVAWRFDEREIDREALLRSNVIEKIKQNFSFAKVNVPEDLERENIVFDGGKFSFMGEEIIIEEFRVGGVGFMVSTWGETKNAKAFLDEVCKIIDDVKLFEPLITATKRERFITQGKVKLNVSPNSFLSKEFLSFLGRISNAFQREDFSLEIHPHTIGTAFVLKPDLQKISKKSLSTTEMARLLDEIRPYSLEFSIDRMKDYYNQIYNVSVRADSETWNSILQLLESSLT